MGFQVKEPILVIGLGGAGSRLAVEAKNVLNSDCLIISNDDRDFTAENQSIRVTTDSVINPSVPLIRGSTYRVSDEIRSIVSKYSTVILMGNLAGKAGSAMAPIVSEICKGTETPLISFAIMPFKYEKDRIFNSGISLKRLRADSECTIVLDNDSLLESNPDLSPKTCYTIANSAIMHIVRSLEFTEMTRDTSILSTGRANQDMEDSLRDSLKMLYEDAPSNSVKRSMIYVVGGDNIPAGIINSVTDLASGIVNQSNSQIDKSSSDSKIVMLSSIQGMTKFDRYDPLGAIPQEDTLDWSTPDCSIDCKLDLYQME